MRCVIAGLFLLTFVVLASDATAEKFSADDAVAIYEEMIVDTTTFVPVVIRAKVIAKGEKIGEVSVVLKDTTVVQFGTTKVKKVFDGGTLVALTLENTDGWVREETFGKPYTVTLDGEQMIIQNRRIKTYKREEKE